MSEGLGHIFHRTDSRFAPSQWETALLNKDVSHLLGASLESALFQYLGRDQFSETHKETKIFSINGVVWSAWRVFACDDLYLPWYYYTCRLISAATEMTAAIYEPLAVHFPLPMIRRDKVSVAGRLYFARGRSNGYAMGFLMPIFWRHSSLNSPWRES